MASNPPPDCFTHEFRVRYAEIDPQSVVFNSRYLEYADLIITEFWRELGLHFTGEGSLEFHVVRAEIDFVQPIHADEFVQGCASTTRIGTSSVETCIWLHGAGGNDDLRAKIILVHVHVDLESGRSMPIPEKARRALQSAQKETDG